MLRMMSGIASLTVIPALACVWRAFRWLMVPSNDGFEMPVGLIVTRAAMLAVAVGVWGAWLEPCGSGWPHMVIGGIWGAVLGAMVATQTTLIQMMAQDAIDG